MRGRLLAAVVMAGSCAAAAAAPMPFTSIDRGNQSSIETKREAVVRSAAEWTTLWGEHASARPRPSVDFSRSMILGVFLGTRPTGGHSVEITHIERQDDALVVTYRERRPAPSDIVTQMLTAPYALVTTERFIGPVRFAASTR